MFKLGAESSYNNFQLCLQNMANELSNDDEEKIPVKIADDTIRIQTVSCMDRVYIFCGCEAYKNKVIKAMMKTYLENNEKWLDQELCDKKSILLSGKIYFIRKFYF